MARPTSAPPLAGSFKAITIGLRRKWYGLIACVILQVAVLSQPQLWQMGLELPVSAFNASSERYRAYTGLVALFVMAFILAGGVLGDLYGRRRVLLIGAVGFVVVNVLSLAANSLETYVVTQTVVNCAGGLLLPLTFAYLRVLFKEERTRMQALLIYSLSGIAGAALPLLAILLADWFSWQATLVIPIVLGAAGGVLAWQVLPENKADGHISRSHAVITTSLALLMMAVMFGLLLGQLLNLGGLWITLITLGVAFVGGGALLFQGLVRRQNLTAEVVRRRQLVVLLLVVITISFGLIGFMLPLYSFFINVYDWGYVVSGAALAPIVLVLLAGFGLARRLVLRYRDRLLVAAGIGMMGLAAALMATVRVGVPYLVLVVPMTLFAFGYLLSQTAWSSMYLRVLPEDLVGVSSAISKAAGRIGGALAGTVAATTLIAFGTPDLVRRLAALGLNDEQIVLARDALDTLLQGGSSLNLGPVPDDLASTILLGAYRDAYATGYSGGQLVMAAAFLLVALIAWLWLHDDDRDDLAAADLRQNAGIADSLQLPDSLP